MPEDGVADASLLLSLGGVSELDLLWDDPDLDWHLTPIARGEIQSEPTRTEISHAILDGKLATTELDTDSEKELSLFVRWSRLVDAGEAEAIAVALARGWVVGVEDLFAQRKVTSEAGSDQWVNVATLLVAAVRQGRMRLPEADAIFVRLDCYAGYRKRGVNSLSDLV
ncbi:MAG: hypothetical protein ACN0LA_13625 [Candidatus Longimicrobiales bacterium M2_2A_002]